MAKLLNRPYTNEEKRQILDMLRGNINRISVSTDVEEIVCQLNFAVDRLSAVAYLRLISGICTRIISDRRKIHRTMGADISLCAVGTLR